MKVNVFLLLASLLITSFTSYAKSTVEIRFSESSFDETRSELFIDIEIKSANNTPLSLGSQNYRLYYDSKALNLIQEESLTYLPSNLYSEIEIIDHLKDFDAHEVSELVYDNRISFVNFNINLTNDVNGGIEIAGDNTWTKVARLKFNVTQDERIALATWARTGLTDGYASAFVQISEWKSPFQIETVEIVKYHDLAFEKSLNQSTQNNFNFELGPNPTADFLKVTSDHPLFSGSEIVISDVSGKLLKTISVTGNSNYINIDIRELSHGLKLLAIFDKDKNGLIYEKFVIAK